MQGNYGFHIYFNLLGLLEALFPKTCPICKTQIDTEEVICIRCELEGVKTHMGLTEAHPMKESLLTYSEIKQVTALYLYKTSGFGNLAQLLSELKFKGQRSYAKTLIDLGKNELDFLFSTESIDALIPVPMHPLKEWIRGHNHAVTLAEYLSRVYCIKLLKKALYKGFELSAQKKKNRHQRVDSPHQIFYLNKCIDIKNLHVLLIDDIYTTGATIRACIEVLRTGSIAHISVLTIFYTPSKASYNVVTLYG